MESQVRVLYDTYMGAANGTGPDNGLRVAALDSPSGSGGEGLPLGGRNHAMILLELWLPHGVAMRDKIKNSNEGQDVYID